MGIGYAIYAVTDADGQLLHPGCAGGGECADSPAAVSLDQAGALLKSTNGDCAQCEQPVLRWCPACGGDGVQVVPAMRQTGLGANDYEVVPEQQPCDGGCVAGIVFVQAD
jgi:hypothetical protein